MVDQAGLWGDGDQCPTASLGQGLMAPGWAEMVSWVMGRVGGALGRGGMSGPVGAPGAPSLGRSHPCAGTGWDRLLRAALREQPQGS